MATETKLKRRPFIRMAVQRIRQTIQPFYKPKPDELEYLEQWFKLNPELKDYVYQVPKDYKKPSLYHPAYLGKRGETEKDIENVELNCDSNGLYNYAYNGDEVRVPLRNINPNYLDSVNIFDNLDTYIGNLEELPVKGIIFSQNNEALEVMQFVPAGQRLFKRNTFDKSEDNKRTKVRANARKKSRVVPSDKSLRGNRWEWAHLLPVGLHGSESDERLGITWWSEDNSGWKNETMPTDDSRGAQTQFENRWNNRDEGFYWLTRIVKYDDGNYAGLVWEYHIYDKLGNELDSLSLEHLEAYRDEKENPWSPTNSDSRWEWNFGIDHKTVAPPDEDLDLDEAEDDIMADYVYSTKPFGFKSKKADLVVSFGSNDEGVHILADLASPEACHCIYCGTTGSGKSVQVVSIISQLMIKNTPQQVQFIGIDPKMTEFGIYKKHPYFAFDPIIDVNSASMASRYALMVSETRSAMFVEVGAKNLDQYNEWVITHPKEAEKKQFGILPHLFLLTDEFASLMTTNREENEDSFNRIAAEGRAQGAHAHLATQRPSVDVIPGTMKNNFPAKCGLSMGSAVDSATLMEVKDDDINPHQLKGRGDNILQTQSIRARSQGYFFSPQDIEHINSFLCAMYYGVIQEYVPDTGVYILTPDFSKATQVNYKRDLIRAGLAELDEHGNIVLIKKKG